MLKLFKQKDDPYIPPERPPKEYISPRGVERVKALQRAAQYGLEGNTSMADVWTRKAHKLAEEQGFYKRGKTHA